MITLASIYVSLLKKADALSLLDTVEPVILETLGINHEMYKEYRDIKAQLENLPS